MEQLHQYYVCAIIQLSKRTVSELTNLNGVSGVSPNSYGIVEGMEISIVLESAGVGGTHTVKEPNPLLVNPAPKAHLINLDYQFRQQNEGSKIMETSNYWGEQRQRNKAKTDAALLKTHLTNARKVLNRMQAGPLCSTTLVQDKQWANDAYSNLFKAESLLDGVEASVEDAMVMVEHVYDM